MSFHDQLMEVESLIALCQTKMNMHQKALDTIKEAIKDQSESEIQPRFFFVKGLALGIKGLGHLTESI